MQLSLLWLILFVCLFMERQSDPPPSVIDYPLKDSLFWLNYCRLHKYTTYARKSLNPRTMPIMYGEQTTVNHFVLHWKTAYFCDTIRLARTSQNLFWISGTTLHSPSLGTGYVISQIGHSTDRLYWLTLRSFCFLLLSTLHSALTLYESLILLFRRTFPTI